MTAHHDADRRIRAFLDDGPELLPDAVFDALRGDIHRTRQRVVIGPWRNSDMSNVARYGLIAAAVVVLVGAGAFLLRPAPAGIAAPSTGPSPAATAPGTPSPSPTETAAPSPTLVPGAVPPGPYRFAADGGAGDAALTVTIPSGGPGWTASDGLFIAKATPSGPLIGVWPGGITGTYVDPCFDHTLKKPAPKGVDGLIEALADQPGISSDPPVDVTVSGYSGRYVDLTVTQDITQCDGGPDEAFWIWDGNKSDRRYVLATGELDRIYAIDVNGKRFTFNMLYQTDTAEADRLEAESILETAVITGVASPSPSP